MISLWVVGPRAMNACLLVGEPPPPSPCHQVPIFKLWGLEWGLPRGQNQLAAILGPRYSLQKPEACPMAWQEGVEFTSHLHAQDHLPLPCFIKQVK